MENTKSCNFAMKFSNKEFYFKPNRKYSVKQRTHRNKVDYYTNGDKMNQENEDLIEKEWLASFEKLCNIYKSQKKELETQLKKSSNEEEKREIRYVYMNIIKKIRMLNDKDCQEY